MMVVVLTTVTIIIIIIIITIVNTSQNHQRSICNRCSNSQQSQPSQHHHREAPEVYRPKEELMRILVWQLTTVYIIPLVVSTTGISPNKLHESLKLPNLHPALYILMQKTVILNTRRIVRKFLAEQSVRPVFFQEPAKLL
jgi:hypothetical protein